MATYAIGDIQGCCDEFMALLDHVNFDPLADRLWLCGDLVNRGPRSLAVMREVMQFDVPPTTVLGNHDLHFLARARAGVTAKRRDTLDEVLAAPGCAAIVNWLRCQRLFHFDPGLNVAIVHAGVPQSWNVEVASQRAAEVEAVLRDDHAFDEFLAAMYGDEPRHWHTDVSGMARLRLITNYFTRMRYLDADGGLDLDEKRAPEQASRSLTPWYAVPDRAMADVTIVFGHWSTLRLSAAECLHYNVYPLDTGAVWGGQLSALRLEDRRWFRVPSRQARHAD